MEKKISLEETLLPALLQCFGIIFLGYVFGKFKILGEKEAKGISTFVQYLSLPALIFTTISTTSFTDVKWEFVAAVFVSKTCIFICVALMTLLLTHPPHLGKSGMFAIAATQSNDFALGYPLFVSVYANTHPQYPIYVYIIAPIQLLVLNTVGFFFLETEKQKYKAVASHRWQFLHVLKEMLKNPIVFMTIIGLIWNVTYGQKVLPIFGPILKAFSSAFAATALLLVGHTMAAKSENSSSVGSLTVALLVFMKNLIFPVILQKFSAFMLQGSNQREIESFCSFGFLYGTMPTAPSVYVFATQYEMCVDVITKTIIISTLLSAPLMFASASVISLSWIGIENMTFYLNQTIGYLSSINFFCSIWLFILLLIGKRWQRISYGIIIHLVFAQMLTAIGGILSLFSLAENSAVFYVQYTLSIGGIYATRMCAFFWGTLLLVVRWRSLCFILQAKTKINILSVLCLSLSFVIAGVIIASRNISNMGPNCQLGFPQIVATFVITVTFLFGTILCLILQHVCFRKKYTRLNSAKDQNATIQNSCLECTSAFQTTTCAIKDRKDIATSSDDISIDVEDIGKHFTAEHETLLQEEIENHICDSRYECSVGKRLHCTNEICHYIEQHEEIGPGLYDSQHIFKQIILLIALSIGMTVSLSVCFWKLVGDDTNGIFVELEFLDIIINYSQGTLCFLIFGLDNGLLNTISKLWRKLMLVNNKIKNIEDTAPAVICEQFINKHYEKCKIDIGKVNIIDGVEYNYSFPKSNFVEWLIKNRILQKVSEAEIYISYLQQHNIVEEINQSRICTESQSLFWFSDITVMS